jgi:hypothetical protein
LHVDNVSASDEAIFYRHPNVHYDQLMLPLAQRVVTLFHQVLLKHFDGFLSICRVILLYFYKLFLQLKLMVERNILRVVRLVKAGHVQRHRFYFDF